MHGETPIAADTKNRILAAALTLFNEEGEEALSAVDIAAALGISPGHLYYHFKGKREIAAALLARHTDEMSGLLAPLPARPDRDAVRAYVMRLLEGAEAYRFLHEGAAGLARRYPELAPRYRRVVSELAAAIKAMLRSSGFSQESAAQRAPILTAALLASVTLDALVQPSTSRQTSIARAAESISALCMPD